MLRVLQVVTDMRRGGLETMLMNYYRVIDKNKIQFDFLTHRDYLGDYGTEIQKLGGKIYHISRLNPFSPSYKKELNNFFIDHPEYQIIHVHQDCMSSVILKIAKKQGIKVRIAHSHANSQDKNIKYPIKLLYKKWIPKYATDLLACGKSAGDWMFKGVQYKILVNAIDAKQYRYNIKIREQIRKELGIAEDELIIGHVGRFSPAKNHIFLLRIFQRLLKRKNAKLLLVGDGELKQKIETEIEKLELSGKVLLTGVRTNIGELMQVMDVFVLPSIYEGLGIVGVEAQAAGLPCVISENVPDEAVITKNVRKVALSDSEDYWVKVILEAEKVERKDTYNEICEAGYDIESNSVKLEKYYFDLLKEKE